MDEELPAAHLDVLTDETTGEFVLRDKEGRCHGRLTRIGARAVRSDRKVIDKLGVGMLPSITQKPKD